TPRQQVVYIIDVFSSPADRRIVLQAMLQERKLNGDLSKPKKSYIPQESLSQLPDPDDSRFLSILLGSTEYFNAYNDYQSSSSILRAYKLTSELAEFLLPLIANKGRLFVARDPRSTEISPLKWDFGEAFLCRLKIDRPSPEKKIYESRCYLRRGSEEYDLK